MDDRGCAYTASRRKSIDNQILHYIASQTGAVLGFYSAIASIAVYIAVSILTCREPYELDKLLNRGKYAIEGEHKDSKPITEIKKKINDNEITKADKVVSMSVIVWGGFWFVIFIIGAVLNWISPISDELWGKFWSLYVWICMTVGTLVTIWFAIGGFINLRQMFAHLANVIRDNSDNGTVKTRNEK